MERNSPVLVVSELFLPAGQEHQREALVVNLWCLLICFALLYRLVSDGRSVVIHSPRQPRRRASTRVVFRPTITSGWMGIGPGSGFGRVNGLLGLFGTGFFSLWSGLIAAGAGIA